VQAPSVVKTFDVIEHHESGLLFGFWNECAEALGFQRGQKLPIAALS
jgi:hypothetical protein